MEGVDEERGAAQARVRGGEAAAHERVRQCDVADGGGYDEERVDGAAGRGVVALVDYHRRRQPRERRKGRPAPTPAPRHHAAAADGHIRPEGEEEDACREAGYARPEAGEVAEDEGREEPRAHPLYEPVDRGREEEEHHKVAQEPEWKKHRAGVGQFLAPEGGNARPCARRPEHPQSAQADEVVGHAAQRLALHCPGPNLQRHCLQHGQYVPQHIGEQYGPRTLGELLLVCVQVEAVGMKEEVIARYDEEHRHCRPGKYPVHQQPQGVVNIPADGSRHSGNVGGFGTVEVDEHHARYQREPQPVERARLVLFFIALGGMCEFSPPH